MARILFKIVVVLGFAAAVFGLVTVVRASGILEDKVAVVPVSFEDVPPNYRHREQIENAVKVGLLTPESTTVFGIHDAVTREEFAVAVVKLMGWAVGTDENEVFEDVEGTAGEIDPADYVAVIAQQNAMSGVAGDRPMFMPDSSVTIEHALRVIVRAAADRLDGPVIADAAIDALQLSDELKDALQIAQEEDLLDGTGIDPATSDFKGPLLKETAAVLLANVEAALSGS